MLVQETLTCALDTFTTSESYLCKYWPTDKFMPKLGQGSFGQKDSFNIMQERLFVSYIK